MMIHAIKSQKKKNRTKSELIKIAWELHCTMKVKQLDKALQKS